MHFRDCDFKDRFVEFHRKNYIKKFLETMIDFKQKVFSILSILKSNTNLSSLDFKSIPTLKIMSLKRNSIVIILALIVMFMYFLNNYASEQQFESLPKRNAKSFFKYKPQFQEIQNKVNKIESHFYNESITIEKYSKADEEKVLKFYKNILTKENRYTSQNKEDGVIIAILNFLKFNKPGYYVEFGTETGIQINTRHLREVYKWKGIF